MIAGRALCTLLVPVIAILTACSSTPPLPQPDLLHCAGCDATPSPAHVAGGAIIPIDRGAVYALMVGTYVCSAGPHVKIESITLHQPTPGIVLRAWGISNYDRSGLGAADGSLRKLGSYGSHTVTDRCRHGHNAKVGVELVRTANRRVHTRGFDVHYRSGGARKTLWLGYSVALRPRSKTGAGHRS